MGKRIDEVSAPMLLPAEYRRRSAIQRVMLENFEMAAIERVGPSLGARERFIRERGVGGCLDELMTRDGQSPPARGRPLSRKGRIR